MAGTREVVRTAQVPRNVGIQGFLRTVEEILKKPMVQSISIDARGSVTYKRYILEGEEEDPANFAADYGDLTPSHLIRNSDTTEYLCDRRSTSAAVIAGMLDHVTSRNFTPIAFVIGVNSPIRAWYYYGTGRELQSDQQLFGYPMYSDKGVPDSVLVLCAGLGRTHALADTRYSLKVEIPDQSVLKHEVEDL